MARPKVPLIERSEVVRTALEILDAEGMQALSIRRLGKELNVNGASLYHHFANKDEILTAVGRAILREVEVPEMADDSVDWVIHTAVNQRRVLLRHPEVIPLQIRGYLRIANLPAYEHTERILQAAGIPRRGVQPLVDAIEALIVGSVVVLLMPTKDAPAPTQERIEPVRSRQGGRAAERRSEREFVTMLTLLIDGYRDRLSAGG